MWVLGGNDGSSFKNDVWWSVDGASWTKLTDGYVPLACQGHGYTAVALGDKMFLMGGLVFGLKNRNDVWVYQQTN